MSETWSAIQSMAGTPVGMTVLVVIAVLAGVAGGVLAWRVIRYLYKASLWLLLLLVVLALAAGAVWAWLEHQEPDPARRARVRQEVMEVLRPERIEQALDRARAEAGKDFPGGDDADDVSED